MPLAALSVETAMSVISQIVRREGGREEKYDAWCLGVEGGGGCLVGWRIR